MNSHKHLGYSPSIACSRAVALVLSIVGFELGVSAAHADAGGNTIVVSCDIEDEQCITIIDPNPAVINVDESVRWHVSASCDIGPPCEGACTISAEAVPGFDGFEETVLATQQSSKTPPFTQPGMYFYTVACSLGIVGEIHVIAPPIPTVSEWGLIILFLLLLTAGTIVIRRAMVNREAALAA